MTKRSKKKQKENRIEWIYLIPLMLVLIVVPLAVHAHVYQSTADICVYGGEGGEGAQTAIEFISYYKSVFLLVAAAAMAVFFLYSKLMDDRKTALPMEKKEKTTGVILWAGLLLYSLMAFLSACFSDYKNYAFHGMDGLFESVWVLLAYALTAFYTFYMVNGQSMVKKLLTIFKIGMSLLCLYGIVEIFFGNPLGWDSFRYLLYSQNQLANYGDAREFAFQGLTLTFYNSNYVASLLALAIPVSLMAVFAEEKPGNKIWFGILFFLEWIMLIACKARSGLPAVLVSLLLLVIFMRKQLLKQKKWLFAGLAVILVGYLAVEIPNGFSYSKRFAALFAGEEKKAKLEKIETLADSVEITYEGNTLSITYGGYEEEKPFVAMCDGEEISYKEEGGIWSTEDSRFTAVQLAATGNAQIDYFDVGIEGLGWRFIDLAESGGYYYVNPAHQMIKMEEAKKAFPSKFWSFGSGRGYIWAKAVPLLKDYIFFGSGPDTFYMVYPWNDYVDQASVMAKEKIFKRPHSMYLQMGIQTGGISLLAFLIFAGGYVASSIKLYGRKKDEELEEAKQDRTELLGMGIAVGVLGYLIVGLVNDSMVGVAQFFWCFIGFGFAINGMVRKNRKKA